MKKGEFKMEKEQGCFAKIKAYLKAKFADFVNDEGVKEGEASTRPSIYSGYDPLLPMGYDPLYPDYMSRHERMMYSGDLYDPELDDVM